MSKNIPEIGEALTNLPGALKVQPKDTSKGHFYVSLVKSGLRIVAGGCFITAGYSIMTDNWLIAGGVLLVGAEILGILEELV